MVKCFKKEYYQYFRLDLIFHALADRTRRDILFDLWQKLLMVNQIAVNYEVSLSAISKHLRFLEDADLITRIREGKYHNFKLKPETLREALRDISFLTKPSSVETEYF